MMLKGVLWVWLTGVFAVGNAETPAPIKSAMLLTLPKADWVLEVEGADLVVEQKAVTPDGKKARCLAVDWASGILLTVFLEDQGKPATAEQCRDLYFAKLKDTPPKEEEIVQSRLGDMAVAEYLVKEYAGRQMNQKHVNAYLTRGNVWMDIHLSKMEFKEGERERFNTILRTVKLVPKKSVPKVRTSYRIGPQVILRLDVPPGWRDGIRPDPNHATAEIAFVPVPAGSAQVLITVLSPRQDMSASDRLAATRKTVEDAGKGALPQAVETSLDIREFQGQASTGYLFTLTDKAPKPNEYKYMTQGGYGVDSLILLFTILSHEKDSDVSRLALEMVGSAQAVADRPLSTPMP